MKRILIYSLLIVVALPSIGQGTLRVNTGVNLKTTKNVYLVFNNMNLVNNGSLTQSPQAGTLLISGNTNTSTSGTGTTVLNNLILAVNNNNSHTLSSAVALKNILTISSGQLVSNGYLTLKSDSSNTANIAAVSSTATPAISGNVVAERYVRGRRKYRIMCSSVTTNNADTLTVGQEAQSIWGNWQNAGVNTAARGTIITGGAAADGFDQQTQNVSMYQYDDSARSLLAFSTARGKNTKYTPLKAGKAYYMFIYGDRTNTISTSNPNSTVIKETGTVLTGNQVYNTQSAISISNVTGRYSLMGNPFASPINWATVSKTNIQNTFWGWDPNLSGSGGFVTVNTAGNVTLISPFTGTTGITQYIQPGQGFFIQTSGASPQMTIKEQDKVTTQNNVVFRSENAMNSVPLMAVNLQYMNGAVKYTSDGVVAAFDSSFLNLVNEQDAVKMENNTECISLVRDSISLSIEARKLPQQQDTLFLSVKRLTRPQYILQIFCKELGSSNLLAYLQDNYLGTNQVLSLTDTNNVVVNINSGVPASFSKNRFQILFMQTPVVLPLVFIDVNAVRKNKYIEVSWQGPKQSEVLKYNVYRSADGSAFNKAAEVAAFAGIGIGGYKWQDNNPGAKLNFYKIDAVNKDGHIKASKTVFVKAVVTGDVFNVYPNPVLNGYINLAAYKLPADIYYYRVINMQGVQIMQGNFQHTGGALNHVIHLVPYVAAGKYYLELVSQNKNIRQSISIKL